MREALYIHQATPRPSNPMARTLNSNLTTENCQQAINTGNVIDLVNSPSANDLVPMTPPGFELRRMPAVRRPRLVIPETPRRVRRRISEEESLNLQLNMMNDQLSMEAFQDRLLVEDIVNDNNAPSLGPPWITPTPLPQRPVNRRLNKHRSRRWGGTVNNYTGEQENNFRYWCDEVARNSPRAQREDIEYICFGKEKAPTTGTPHLQFYIQFKKNKLKTAEYIMRNIFCSFAMNIERYNGSSLQNKLYCSKTRPEDTEPNEEFYEGGEAKEDSNQGKRTDIDDLKELIINDPLQNLEDLFMGEYFVTYHRYEAGLMRVLSTVMKRKMQKGELPRCNGCKVEWIYGATGVGKSRYAYRDIGQNMYNGYLHSQNVFKWWDGYKNHQLVIIDDFQPSNFKFRELLTIMDRNLHTVEVKHGTALLIANHFIVTSDKPPWELYAKTASENNNKLNQLIRRLYAVEGGGLYHMTSDGKTLLSKQHCLQEVAAVENSYHAPGFVSL